MGLGCAFKSSLKGTEFGGRATDCRKSQVYSCISRSIHLFQDCFTSIFIRFTFGWIRNSFFIIFCLLTEAETIKHTTNNSRDSNCSSRLPPKGLLYSFRDATRLHSRAWNRKMLVYYPCRQPPWSLLLKEI